MLESACRIRIDALQKMEMYNMKKYDEDKAGQQAWTLVKKGYNLVEQGDQMRAKKGLYMHLQGQCLRKEGLEIRDAGCKLLKIKYTNIMQGHERNTKSNTNCYWEHLGRLVEWLTLSNCPAWECNLKVV